ncbi:MAG TPA: sigma-70 family RNA polymerase sigma factor [Dongiaceae bacterium]|nr:sigma-70 family RNA polymerase sigma factor [Dongiaceae bacterium]
MSYPVDESIPTRYSLLSRLQDWGDQESWRCFFDTYWRLIYSVARRSGLDDSAAQDVVQETVIGVAQNIHKFRRDPAAGSFKGWLLNLTRWRIADQFRKRKGVGSPASPLSVGDDPGNVPAELEVLWDAEWQSNLLQTALERVKNRVRAEHYQIFNLNVVQEWPAAKVAAALEINIGRVYLAKHRVAALLRAEIKQLEKELY